VDTFDLQLAVGRAGALTARALHTALQRVAPLESTFSSSSLRLLVGQPRAVLLACAGLSQAASTALSEPDWNALERDRLWAERERVQLIDALSTDYPPRLSAIPDAPALIYVQGEITVLRSPQLAMVGSRNPTDEGRRTAHEFAAHLVKAGLTVTSGLALGIDGASHAGALEGQGKSVAVLGSGLDRLYPESHTQLAQRIRTCGALVSEFPPGTPPLRPNFPRRNRIISGLSLGTLVVEAARHSGSLLTARLAAEQGREVFAIPGSIHNPLARGCHELIRSGAKLVECGADILRELNFSIPQQLLMQLPAGSDLAERTAEPLDKDYKILLDAIGFGLASIDSLVDRTGLPSHSVASMLLILELEGAVRMQDGGRYMRIQSR
jgi:DNA processing protein